MVSDKKCLFGGVAVAAWGRHRLEIGEVGWGLVENQVKEPALMVNLKYNLMSRFVGGGGWVAIAMDDNYS